MPTTYHFFVALKNICTLSLLAVSTWLYLSFYGNHFRCDKRPLASVFGPEVGDYCWQGSSQFHHMLGVNHPVSVWLPLTARDTCNRCGAVKQGLSGDIFGMIGGNGPSHSGRVRWAFYRFETWEEHSWNWRRIRKIFRNASKEFDTLVECDHLCLFKETPVNVSKKATCVKFALYWAVSVSSAEVVLYGWVTLVCWSVITSIKVSEYIRKWTPPTYVGQGSVILSYVSSDRHKYLPYMWARNYGHANVWVSVNMQSKKVLSCVKLARVYQSHICEQVLAYGRYGTPAAAM